LSRRNRRWVGLVALVATLIVAGLVIAACGSSSSSSSSSPSSAGTPKAGGTFTFPLGSDPISIEPLNLQEVDANYVAHQVFQSLYKIAKLPDGSWGTVPDLVAKTVMSPDAKTFTFTLKQGITFAPPVNREVTAQDVVDDWNYVLDPAHKSVTAAYDFQDLAGLDPKTGMAFAGRKVSSLKVLSKYSFQAQLNQPFSQFTTTLVSNASQVFPADYAKKVGLQAFANKPVGTGPYMVQSWVHNQGITLVKNPNYWNKSATSPNSAGPGYVDEISFPVYQTASTSYLAFQKGTLDASMIPTGSWIAAQNLPNVKSGQWSAIAYPNSGVQFIAVTMNKQPLGGAQNLKLRIALMYATDRISVCNIAQQGVMIPNDQFVPQTMPGYKPGLNPYPYDPAKAQPELDQFTAAGGKIPAAIPYSYNQGFGADKNAQVLVAGWQKAMPSLNFTLHAENTNTFFTDINNNKVAGMYRYGWSADWPSIDDFIYLFTTKGGVYGSGTRYSNAEVDKLFNEARAETDTQKAYALYNQAEALVLKDAPCLPVFTYRDPWISNDAKVGGFFENPYSMINMWDVWVK